MGGALDELIEILRSLSASLTEKFSHLLSFFIRYKHVSSVGAVAGFALAVLCTWRYLHSSRPRRSSHKDTATRVTSATDGETSATASGAARSITHATHRASASAREELSPSQITLSSVVKRQLNGGRRMTCQVVGTVLEDCGEAELQNIARVRPGAVEVIKELGRSCDLYLLARVPDDATEAGIVAALDSAGLFSSGALSQDKVLFCSTQVGIMSFVRQLEPDWHVDTSEETISQLKRFVRHQLWIAPPGAPDIATNVVSTPTIERYFGLSI